jgi:acyl-CoA thioesterase I
MKIISVLGNSLSMPNYEDGISIKKTYAYQIQKELKQSYYTLNFSKRGNTTTLQTKEQYLYDEVFCANSNVVIVQLGIVDCCPRIISLKEAKFIKYILPNRLKNIYINIKSKYRQQFTKYFPKVYVSKKTFESNYRLLISKILKGDNIEKVILINIAKTNDRNKSRSYGFERNIAEYNDVIKKLSKSSKIISLIDINTVSQNNSSFLLKDGIHINLEMHGILKDKIRKIIHGHD